MAEPWRLFVATALPTDVSTAVWEGLAPLRSKFPATRWIRPALLHFTLVFMGNVAPDRVEQLTARLGDVARRHDAFRTATDGAGGHVDDGPGRRPGGVAWLTLGEGVRETADLATDVDTAIGSRSYDERRRPRPHLTVARAVDAAALAALRGLAPTLRLEWLTSDLVLFRSHLGQGGSRYEPLHIERLRRARQTS